MSNVIAGTEKGNDIKLHYIDCGEGDPVVLIHGWPLSHRMWERQIPVLVSAGHRVIAYDRRGFGESDTPWDGYDYDSLASDLNLLLESLDLQSTTLIGFSMGGGEVARYIGTYGTGRIKKAVLMSSVTPYLAKTPAHKNGVSAEVFEEMLSGLKEDRLDFLRTFIKSFYNWEIDGHSIISEAELDYAWNIAVMASPRATIECVKAFAATDFRKDLNAFTIPTLILHGDADQIVPYEVTGKIAHGSIKSSKLEVITRGAHGIPITAPERVNAILVDFLG